MRPLRLTMQAFGPYKEVQKLDFADLGVNKLFLVHGQTGAGKTSILDAMCYALYGDTSGGQRNGAQMRCESAAADMPTEITFDFALGDKCFRVQRRPKQELAAQRGAGMVVKQPEAALWETSVAGIEGQPLATKIREVDSVVRDLLGFSSDQFRQVVMLPQGKFRDLLDSGSDKREEILRQLFRTERFAAVERLLSERARDVSEQRKQLQMTRRARLEAADVQDDAELKALTAESMRAVKTAAGELKKAEKRVKEATVALRSAEDAEASWQALGRAEADLERLLARTGEIAALDLSVALALKAAKLGPLAGASSDAEAEVGEAGESRSRLAAELKSAESAEKRASTTLAAVRKRAAEREAADEEVRGLTKMRTDVAKWQKADEAREAAESTYAATQSDLQDARDTLVAAQEDLEQAKKSAGEAAVASEQLKTIEAELKQARETVQRCERLDSARTVAKKRQDELGVAKGKEAGLLEALEERERECARVEAAWREARGAALAKTLEDGKPCPVCGSTEHPTPAISSVTVEDEALDNARAVLEEQRRVYEGMRKVVGKAERDAASADAEVQTLEKEIASGDSLKSARARLTKSEAKRDALNGVLVEAGDTAELLAEARDTAAEADKRLRDAEAVDKKASSAMANALASATQLAEGIPAELRSIKALEKALTVAKTRKDQLDVELAQAEQAQRDSHELVIALTRDVKAANQAFDKAKKRLDAAIATFDKALVQEGFATLDDYESALMREADLKAAQDTVRVHRESVAHATGCLAVAKEAVANHPDRGDLAALRGALDETETARDEASMSKQQAEITVAALEKTRADLDELDQKSAEVEEQYAVIGQLADVANGQSGGAKISFQRWVLGAYLDDVLAAATRRLSSMSKGRYRLQRQRVASDRKRATGLDLAVLDGWSNRVRPAVTLSGGESFLAALSLALGLAETVQEQSGGTPLETVFVDEGFGALDSDALDLAMEALMDLKDTGRLVGVISHVPELRQVIDARLEVTGGPGGSSAQFVVP